ncbi:MAG: ThuA domain-containing protein [Cyclobacteriaceae bacterium]|nr:ThuA domain-containing protein [Cyclobacteriaceae bacterium]
MKYKIIFFVLLVMVFFNNGPFEVSIEKEIKPKKQKALIIDGENNHGVWPKTTIMMKDFLEKSGLFTVDIQRTAYTWQGPHYDPSIGLDNIKELLKLYPLNNGQKTTAVDDPVPDPDYSPNFKKYDVVISNFGWNASSWPEATKTKFEKYMMDGGGLVVVHAANNSWGDWHAFNKMIGIGGWGGRNVETGPYIYYDEDGNFQRDPSDGPAGSHGPQHEYVIETRAPEHPIMKDLPTAWLHTKDELYDHMRGPAENATILATAYSDKENHGGSGRNEPLLLAIEYGKGRVFHTGLGHMGYSMECVGFITTFLRGAEWAATGKVTQEVPDDFPGKDAVSIRKYRK